MGPGQKTGRQERQGQATLSRIIAVVEERDYVAGGWRVRLVDDLSESAATGANCKIESHGLDTMRVLMLFFFQCDSMFSMWNADVKSAFRMLTLPGAPGVCGNHLHAVGSPNGFMSQKDVFWRSQSCVCLAQSCGFYFGSLGEERQGSGSKMRGRLLWCATDWMQSTNRSPFGLHLPHMWLAFGSK